VVDGALQACRADPELELLLVGPRSSADEVTAGLDPAARERVHVLVADRGVSMEDPAASGADPATSIGAAMLAMRAGRAHAVVSAGASGATVAAAVVGVGRASGFRRPALTAILPGVVGTTVLLDVGAGLQVKPVDLVQHALLGIGYARLCAGIDRPRVGLLSVGAEAGKGDKLRRAADSALRQYRLYGGAYVGLVEGDDVVTGARADCVVTDGFTGNVLLKGIEAALGAAPAGTRVGQLPRAAALLGIAGTVVVCHGACTATDLASGVSLAARLVRHDVVRRLADAANGSPLDLSVTT
jgi:glycerol-3-phosphate acyltransferase PlsX